MGTRTTSSPPSMALPPLACSTPITWKMDRLILISLPIGSSPENRFLAVVAPSTATRDSESSCPLLMKEPLSSVTLRTVS